MNVNAEKFPPPVINMVEAYFQLEQARQSRALWPKVRSSGAVKGDSLLPNSLIKLIEFQHEPDDDDVLTIDDLDPVPTEMEDSHIKA
ncbi:hypothetical protein L3X38_045442 [Prunus dulcis]|uniref:Uncharacterized protein n=1 Tax=Prunus dulcis TaxID=3755 RepID=A0AAD4YP13_PRUDU|nr:hypothetical protein L3X38_045442 [Prunus dulcis]